LVVEEGLDLCRAVRLEQVQGSTQEEGRTPGGQGRGVALRFGGGCLFWLLVSVVLSVSLTVLVNLLLYAF